MHFPMAGAGAAPASSRARFCFSASQPKESRPHRGGGAHLPQIWSRIEPGAVSWTIGPVGTNSADGLQASRSL